MRNQLTSKSKTSQFGKFYYFAGLLTSGFIFLLFFLFVGYRVGFADLFAEINSHLPRAEYKNVLYLPEAILNELIAHHGVIDKAGNPTKIPKHNSIVVHPDEELGYVLRPNTEISAHLLKSIIPFNFAPPNLYLNANSALSDHLQNYIREQSRFDYSFTIDSSGFRRTIPVVESDKKLLIVGDSVPFGIGVDDEFTMASYLQKMVGMRYKIINASVGGYNGKQAFAMAKRQCRVNKYSGLIYVACQNDFMESKDWIREAKEVLEKIASLAGEFDGNCVIFFHTYMQYSLHDIFLGKGEWAKEYTEKTDSLRRELPRLCRDWHFAYHDWTDIVDHFQKENRSILSRFALYADHCHLSPLGNQKAAEALFKALTQLNLIE